jgi:hypothetical protein
LKKGGKKDERERRKEERRKIGEKKLWEELVLLLNLGRNSLRRD